MYVIELGVMMLLSLVVLFMVIRPLVKRILASEVVPAPTADDAVPALTDGSGRRGGSPARAWCRVGRHEPDRRRPGPGPGPRADGAPRRRTGRAKPERDRQYRSSVAHGTGVT